MMILWLTKGWIRIEPAIFIGIGVLLIIKPHVKNKLHVTQMILVFMELELDGIRFIPNITTSLSIKQSENLQG